jgi:hypothetical protein
MRQAGKARKAVKAKRAARHRAEKHGKRNTARAHRKHGTDAVLEAIGSLLGPPPRATAQAAAKAAARAAARAAAKAATGGQPLDTSPVPPPPPPTPPQVEAALEFFRRHDMNPLDVLEALLNSRSDGAWRFVVGLEELVVDELTRHELIARLSDVLFPSGRVETLEKGADADDEPKDVL